MLLTLFQKVDKLLLFEVMVAANPVFAKVIFWLPLEKAKELMLKVAVVALVPLALKNPDTFEGLCEKERLINEGGGGGVLRVPTTTTPPVGIVPLEKTELESASELELVETGLQLPVVGEQTVELFPPPGGPKRLTTIWRINNSRSSFVML